VQAKAGFVQAALQQNRLALLLLIAQTGFPYEIIVSYWKLSLWENV
jgi:hypothetical protein